MPNESTSLRSLPTLTELVERPELAAGLPPDVALPLCVKVAALQAALAIASRPPAPVVRTAPTGDRFLNVAEVAERIGKSRSWVQKNHGELPSRRRVGGEGLWSEREIEAWIRHRPTWGDD